MKDDPRVLVVDDEASYRDRHRALAEKLGASVDVAEDGFVGLAKMESGFDLVLLDVQMPGMDGFEMLRRIRSEGKYHDTFVIMVTGLSEKKYAPKARELGADDFFSKPVDEAELSDRIEGIIGSEKVRGAEDDEERGRGEVETTVDRLIAAMEEPYSDKIDSIRRVALATGTPDKGPWTHMQRVGMYCIIIGEDLGLSTDEMEILKKTAPLHDIGKIGVSRRILSKADILTPEEREIIEQHPHIGASILAESPSRQLRDGQKMILHHHEKWDGTGYPDGLEGDNIPLLARICAVADVFDALTAERPYRKVLSVEKALDVMEEDQGQHFEPQMYDVFVRNKDVIRELRQRSLKNDK